MTLWKEGTGWCNAIQQISLTRNGPSWRRSFPRPNLVAARAPPTCARWSMPSSTACGAAANGGCSLQDFPPHQTVYHYFRTWRRAGVWEQMHDSLRGDLREASGRTREPSAGIIDSQTVKTTEKGGSGAMTAASASVGASATSSSMSWGCSWS